MVQVWPGRRIGGDRVGDAITLWERQTNALRGVRRLVLVQGGVMPADPLPARGRAARCPRGCRCPAKGPTETKPTSEHDVTGNTRTSAGPPSGTRVLAASRWQEARGWAERGRRTGPMGQLLEAIADPTNLARAWARVRANAGAAGIDGQSVYAFDADAEHQLASLRRRLLSAELLGQIIKARVVPVAPPRMHRTLVRPRWAQARTSRRQQLGRR